MLKKIIVQMDGRKITILLAVLFLVAAKQAAGQDWAFELSNEAKEIYAKKKIQIPCDRIYEFIQDRDLSDVYIAIRDAGLFKIRKCGIYIKKNLNLLTNLEGVKDAVAFYSYRNGDTGSLMLLAQSFDQNARKVGDHWTVDLFGYLNEWEVTGRRLVRHAKYTDAVGAEALCSAVMWRRYLYGRRILKITGLSLVKKRK